MKQTLLIIALFIGIGNVNAQSDATKEETLNWLNTYLPKFSKQATIDENGNDFTNLTARINYEQDGMIYKALYDENYDDIFTQEMYLTSVIKIEMKPSKDNDTYSIIFWGKDKSASYLRRCEDCRKEGWKGETIYFSFSNKTELERVYKALKHLFTFYNQEVEFVDKIALANKF